MGFFGWLNKPSEDEDTMPPIHLDDNQEYTEEGYLITRDDDGEITKVVNWRDYHVEPEEPGWLSKLFG